LFETNGFNPEADYLFLGGWFFFVFLHLFSQTILDVDFVGGERLHFEYIFLCPVYETKFSEK
jgi:hypothetical protein